MTKRHKRSKLLKPFSTDFRQVNIASGVDGQHVWKFELSGRVALAAESQIDLASFVEADYLTGSAVGNENSLRRIQSNSVRSEARPDFEKFAIQIEHLDSIVLPVADDDSLLFIDHD